MEDQDVIENVPKSTGNSKKRKIEDIYQKKTPIEHILLRPDTYVGSIEMQSKQMWVYENDRMVYRNVQFVPGLYKIFDEILVNAADNKARDPTMDTIKVSVDKENNQISVYNNGKGIPVAIHAKEGVYVPELIFGHLLTSSNYDDNEKKMTGGRNGYGAKLCNIFSTEFVVETSDKASGKQFKQVYQNNMSVKQKPVIKNAAAKDFTRITFKPDLGRFGMNVLDEDIVGVIRKRVYDMAGVVRDVKVFLNDERIKIKSFKEYVDLYLAADASIDESGKKQVPVYECVNDRWEVAVALHDGHQQVSFVNSICTVDGGTHVKSVLDPLIEKIVDVVKKKNKSAKLKPHQVREHLWIFVNCMIENPSFSSQTKESMTLRPSQFGSKCTLTDDFVKKVLKSGVVEMVLEFAKAKQSAELKKTDGNKRSRITGISKLDDANHAGTRHAKNCTLILTEGDSAKALAVSGLSVVGRDLFGVFPLRGKLLNVRDASHSQILENHEIQALKKILGLQQNKAYSSVDELRYGHIMIMTDADSVTGDTPLLLRDVLGNFHIKPIDSLFNASRAVGISPNGKEYTSCNFETWTNRGWSRIKYVMRHKCTKRIYRVATASGIVDVTEDHSLLDDLEEKITPKNISVGQPLLHSFPTKFNRTFNRSEGADESCDDSDVALSEILNGSFELQMTCFKQLASQFSVPSADSNECLRIPGKLKTQLAYFLCKSFGYAVDILNGGDDVYELHIDTHGRENKSGKTVRSITLLGTKTTYVYDLETESHQFNGGVGSLVLHNTDGSHIKGLLINFLEYYWPSLLKIPGFLLEFITPIVRASKSNQEINFYTLPQYQKWKEANDHGKGWHIKYYKGLGTSTAQDAKRYFGDLATHMKTFRVLENQDRGVVDMVFNKKRADDRKSWISQFVPGTFMDHAQETIGLSEFINKELILFSVADNLRSIPSVVDGLKPGQRKILFGCFKRKLFKEVKVAQLAGYVSEHAAYHHGEQSLCQTIIGLAQNYVGSNNVNLLEPVGQFGCLDPETKVLLFDASVKKAKDVLVGDLLVGDDGTPRKVLQLTSGVDEMFQVALEGCEEYFVANSQHIMTLVYPKHRQIFFSSANNRWCLTYLDASAMLIRTVVFEHNAGFEAITRFRDSIKDSGVLDIRICDYLNLPERVRQSLYSFKNNQDFHWNGAVCSDLKNAQVSERRALKSNVRSARESRVLLLETIIEKYGTIESENGFDFAKLRFNECNDALHLESVRTLAVSLGLNCEFTGKDCSLRLSGGCLRNLKWFSESRFRSNAYKFTVSAIGKGAFSGWQLDGNERFLLANGIVTHNSRLQGGKDHASPRYIYTHLTTSARILFNSDDDRLLNYLNDDGQWVEPEFYVPIVPLVLINGAEGIGTGWSTSVPAFSPGDIAANLRRKLESPDADFLPMKPYYRGFTGAIEPTVSGSEEKYKLMGQINLIDDQTIEITELPVGSWTQTYKEYLESLQNSEKQPALVKDFKEYHTDRSVHFVVTVAPDELRKLISSDGLEKKFKLSTQKATSNMVLFNCEGRLRKYGSVNEILEEFYHLRLKFYRERKMALVDQLTKDHLRLLNKVRFVEEIINGQLIVQNRRKSDVVENLRQSGYAAQSQFTTSADSNCDDSETAAGSESTTDFDYLLNMAIWSLTREKIEQLEGEMLVKSGELDGLKRTSVSDLWKYDLDAFLAEWNRILEQDKEEMGVRSAKKARSKGIKLASKPKAAKSGSQKTQQSKKVTASAESSDDEYAIEMQSQQVDSAPNSPLPVRKNSRVRATKPTIYIDSESDSDGEDVDSELMQQVRSASNSFHTSESTTPILPNALSLEKPAVSKNASKGTASKSRESSASLESSQGTSNKLSQATLDSFVNKRSQRQASSQPKYVEQDAEEDLSMSSAAETSSDEFDLPSDSDSSFEELDFSKRLERKLTKADK